jgi:hypothetical protein
MAIIGFTQSATPADLNNRVGSIFTRIRNDFDDLDDLIEWFDTLQTADIENLFGVQAGDVSEIQALVGNHGTLNQIYRGLATLATALNFRANGAPTWGGQ